MKIIDIDTISTIIAAISVIIGVFFAVWELRNLAKQRKTDFLYKLQSSMMDESYRKAWKKIRDSKCATYHECKEKCEREFELVIAFYENLGILSEQKLVDFGIVKRVFGKSIVRGWERCKPYIDGARVEVEDPELYFGFEDLYKKMINELQKPRKNP